MAPFCLRWTAAVAALALPLFLLSPRLDGPTWDSAALGGAPGAGPAPGPRTDDPSMDLNRTGPVYLSDDEVFRVEAHDAGGRPFDLPDDQLWRKDVLYYYHGGRWGRGGGLDRLDVPPQVWPPVPSPPSPRGLSPPALAPGQYSLEFTVRAGAGGLVLAEPVRAGGPAARRTVFPSGRAPDAQAGYVSLRGPVLPYLYNGPREYHYVQTAGPGRPVRRTPADEIDPTELNLLSVQEVPGLREWTAGLLERLADDPRYRAYGVGPAAPGRLLPADRWESTARALADYLADSGDYSYTLDLRAQDASLDPTLDFLRNVKAGHCERFASGLALMLRSQGVPCRVVRGYLGADRLGDGVYRVRERQAHAWVEVLAPQPAAARTLAVTPGMPAAGDPHDGRPPAALGLAVGPAAYRMPRADWVALDPTPPSDGAGPPSLWAWWQRNQHAGEDWWGGLVVNFGPRQQADAWAALTSGPAQGAYAAAGAGAAGLGAVGVLAWALRRARRKRRAAAGAAGLYARLLAALGRAGLRPGPGQTPREFAAEARQAMPMRNW
jgi:transglutaminase-like putative cysteine protease